jgi:hypothetical protein
MSPQPDCPSDFSVRLVTNTNQPEANSFGLIFWVITGSGPVQDLVVDFPSLHPLE